MTTAKSNTEILQQGIDKLNTLKKRQMEISVRLEAEKQKLLEAQQEAQELFGTSDLAQLRALLDSKKKENEEKLEKFMSDLDNLESTLATIERQTST